MFDNGFILIDKDNTSSSFYVDKVIKKKFDLRKVGHLGTLDPFATGLLILGLNSATKMFPYIDDSFKSYIATLKLGLQTDTLDLKGKVVKRMDVPMFNTPTLLSVLNSFIGEQLQDIPLYSAKKLNGERLYKLAKDNNVKDLQIPQKKVFVKNIELLNHTSDLITFKVEVSKGTYIRQLGLDIAKKLNTVGHLISLRRVSIGKYKIEDAISLDIASKENIIPIDKLIDDIKTFEIKSDKLSDVLNGKSLTIESKEPYLFIKSNDSVIGFYKKKDDIYKCVHVFK